MNKVRVRIAPSPTGIPHIGNTRTALFNYLFAKHNRGKFILRIDDTDRARYVPESEEAIIEIFKWLGFTFDENYRQSERLDIYKKHTQELIDNGVAYEEAGAVRFKVPKNKTVTWTDIVGAKTISFQTNDIEDFIILKSDKYPTYHLSHVIDDHLLHISHVIRGEEWISSTPKHILLYESFGWKHTEYAHLPVILGPDKTKLSKRHGAKSALDYRDEGYLPEALLNFMVLLGWNPGGDREILSLRDMIKLFDLTDVNTANPVFDIKKLEWMNGMYIRKSQISNLKSLLQSRIPLRGKIIDDKLLDQLIPLAQTRMKTLNDFSELVTPFFEGSSMKLTLQEKKIAKDIANEFKKRNQWNKDVILSVIKKVLQAKNIKMPIIYRVLTGKESGLPLPQMLEILGKEKVLQRIMQDVRS